MTTLSPGLLAFNIRCNKNQMFSHFLELVDVSSAVSMFISFPCFVLI